MVEKFLKLEKTIALSMLNVMALKLEDIHRSQVGEGLTSKEYTELTEQMSNFNSIVKGTNHIDDENGFLDKAFQRVSDCFEKIEIEQESSKHNSKIIVEAFYKDTHLVNIKGLGEFFAQNT